MDFIPRRPFADSASSKPGHSRCAPPFLVPLPRACDASYCYVFSSPFYALRVGRSSACASAVSLIARPHILPISLSRVYYSLPSSTRMRWVARIRVPQYCPLSLPWLQLLHAFAVGSPGLKCFAPSPWVRWYVLFLYLWRFCRCAGFFLGTGRRSYCASCTSDAALLFVCSFFFFAFSFPVILPRRLDFRVPIRSNVKGVSLVLAYR